MLKLTKKEAFSLGLSACKSFPLKPSKYCVVCSVRTTGEVLYTDRFSVFRRRLRHYPDYCSDTNIFKYSLVELF